MKRLFACALLLFAAAPSLAADANGYTAKYEKQIGTPPACSTVMTISAAERLGSCLSSNLMPIGMPRPLSATEIELSP